MEKAILKNSQPRALMEFIDAKVSEGRFSTPSEYIQCRAPGRSGYNGKVRFDGIRPPRLFSGSRPEKQPPDEYKK